MLHLYGSIDLGTDGTHDNILANGSVSKFGEPVGHCQILFFAPIPRILPTHFLGEGKKLKNTFFSKCFLPFLAPGERKLPIGNPSQITSINQSRISRQIATSRNGKTLSYKQKVCTFFKNYPEKI